MQRGGPAAARGFTIRWRASVELTVGGRLGRIEGPVPAAGSADGLGGVELPIAVHALQLMQAAVFESEVRPGDEVVNGS